MGTRSKQQPARPKGTPDPTLQPEIAFHVGRGEDGTADIRTEARGESAIAAHTYVWIMAIVVAGFVVMAMVMRTRHEDLRRDGRDCTERIERTDHLERIERSCELVDR